MTAGYSGTPLVKKLGIKPGMKLVFVNPPVDYDATLGALPDDIMIVDWRDDKSDSLDFIQFFTKDRITLEHQFSHLMNRLQQNGMLWISWPKKASKMPTDLNENIIREIGLNHGLVDVKVAAIDTIWSGLKFVYRLKDRV